MKYVFEVGELISLTKMILIDQSPIYQTQTNLHYTVEFKMMIVSVVRPYILIYSRVLYCIYNKKVAMIHLAKQ